MDANIALVIVGLLNMIGAIATATLTYYTNKRTKRLEQHQQQIAHGIARIGTKNDLQNAPTPNIDRPRGATPNIDRPRGAY